MFIFVYYKETKSIEVSPESSIDIIKEKLGIKDSFSIEIYWKEKLLPLGKSFNYYGIKQYDMLYLFVITGLDAAPIDNLKDENDLTIGFDMKYIKRDELYVNLIHFDLKMTNSENYGYYKKFKVDVVGGFYASDEIDIFLPGFSGFPRLLLALLPVYFSRRLKLPTFRFPLQFPF